MSQFNANEFVEGLDEKDMENLLSALRNKLDGKAFADFTMDWMNKSGRGDLAEFACHATLSHRTLQQKLFSLFTYCVREWANTKYFDKRNEFTIQRSKKILDKVLNGFAGAPLI